MAEDQVWEVVSNFRDTIAGQAEISERQLTPGLRSIRFKPANPEAAPVWLVVSEAEVVVGIGKGSRFELGTDEADCGLLAELLRAAAEGRVEETTRPFGLSYTVWLTDGTTQTGSSASLSDLWKRSSFRRYGGKRESRRYAPWR